jgi:hypothetical protein
VFAFTVSGSGSDVFPFALPSEFEFVRACKSTTEEKVIMSFYASEVWDTDEMDNATRASPQTAPVPNNEAVEQPETFVTRVASRPVCVAAAPTAKSLPVQRKDVSQVKVVRVVELWMCSPQFYYLMRRHWIATCW